MAKVTCYTSAPQAYDWGWTEEVSRDTGLIDHRDRPVRKVIVLDEYHSDHQQARYGSGLYPCLTQAELDEDQRKKYPTFRKKI